MWRQNMCIVGWWLKLYILFHNPLKYPMVCLLYKYGKMDSNLQYEYVFLIYKY